MSSTDITQTIVYFGKKPCLARYSLLMRVKQSCWFCVMWYIK